MLDHLERHPGTYTMTVTIWRGWEWHTKAQALSVTRFRAYGLSVRTPESGDYRLPNR